MLRSRERENKTDRLLLAAAKGEQETLQQLLDKGANVKVKDKLGRTALHEAVSNGRDTVVQLLLEKGARIEAKDKSGRTVLHEAVQNGHVEIVRQLPEKGADIRSKDSIFERSAVHWAAKKRHKNVVK